jgi:AraC family transcriptional regulator, arabinose operon regulatory protein
MHFRFVLLHYSTMLLPAMETLEIAEYGLQTPHDVDFVVDRPQGYPSHLLTCFSTPAFCRTTSGIEGARPGDCIIHDLVFPQRHGTAAGQKSGFRNDWIHIRGRALPRLMRSYNLPFNVLLPTGRPDLLTPFIEQVAREQSRREAFWTQATSHAVESMLLSIARHWCKNGTATRETPSGILREQFVQLRMTMARQISRNWSVPEMARSVGLSPSRFSVLYRTFFEISPMEDLIRQRLSRARELLTHTDQSVGEVAQACGFSSIYYFSRIFRNRIGCPPGRYR